MSVKNWGKRVAIREFAKLVFKDVLKSLRSLGGKAFLIEKVWRVSVSASGGVP